MGVMLISDTSLQRIISLSKVDCTEPAGFPILVFLPQPEDILTKLPKLGFDTAENDPCEILPTLHVSQVEVPAWFGLM